MAAGSEPTNSILHCTVEILFRNRCAFKSKAQLILEILHKSCFPVYWINLSSKKLSLVQNIFATFVHHCTTFLQLASSTCAKVFFETKNGCRQRFIQLFVDRQDDSIINRPPSTADGASSLGC